MMAPGALTVFAFVAAALAVFGIYSILSDLFLRDRARVSRRVDEEFRRRQRDQIQKSALFKADFARLAAEAAADNDVRPTLRQRFVTMIEQSALKVTPDRLLLIM